MKKVSKQCTAWVLIVAILTSSSTPLYAQVANQESSIEQAVQQATAEKKVPLRKKLRLISLLREFRVAVKSRFQRKPQPVQSLDELRVMYTKDLKILMLKFGIAILLIEAGSLALMGGFLAMAAGGEGAAVGVLGLPLVGVAMVGGAMLPFKVFQENLDARYSKLAYQLFLTKERERVQLVQLIRATKASGNKREVRVLTGRLKKLTEEVKGIRQFQKFTWDSASPLYIDWILAHYGKKMSKSSPLFPVFTLALAKDLKGIQKFLKAGNTSLFEEPWVWPAVAELYYLDDLRKTDDLVKELKMLSRWNTFQQKSIQSASCE